MTASIDDAFFECLENNPEDIFFDASSGRWQRTGFFYRCYRYLFGEGDDDLIKITRFFYSKLEEIEKTQALTQEKIKEIPNLLKTAEKVTHLLSQKTFPKLEKELSPLKREIFAISLRNPSTSPNPNQKQDLEELLHMASLWKKAHPSFQATAPLEIELTDKNRLLLEKASQYEGFTTLLKEDSITKDAFLRAVLVYGISPEFFIACPSTYARLETCQLIDRIASFPTLLRVDKSYDVKLLFESDVDGQEKWVSILDEKTSVVLKHGWKVKIEDIFNAFKISRDEPVSFEVMGGMIRNFNPFKMASWNPKTRQYEHFTGKWWKEITPWATWDLEEVKEKCGLERELKEGEGVVAIVATRLNPSLYIRENHAHFRFIIPNGEGKYSVFPIGKYSAEFPKEGLETVIFAANTVEGAFAIDINETQWNRQKAVHSEIVSQETMEAILEDVDCQINDARQKKISFQFAWKNCAHFVQKTANRFFKKENYFEVPFGSATAEGVQESIFSWLRGSPHGSTWYKIKFWMLSSALLWFRQWNGESLQTSDLRNKFSTFQPAYLCELVRKQLVPGILAFGNG